MDSLCSYEESQKQGTVASRSWHVFSQGQENKPGGPQVTCDVDSAEDSRWSENEG